MNEIEKSRVTEIQQLHAEIGGYLKMTLDKAIRIGELLTAQKTECGHGNWIPWIENNLPFSERLVRDYVRFYDRREELKTARVADLSQARRFLNPPQEQENTEWEKEFQRRAKAVELLSRKAEEADRIIEQKLNQVERSGAGPDWYDGLTDTILLLFLRQRVIYCRVKHEMDLILDYEEKIGSTANLAFCLDTLHEMEAFNREWKGTPFSTAYKRFSQGNPEFMELVRDFVGEN